ncbi:hypothetical protein K2X14_07165 [Acetobacter sp. TBRC 12305]|nr:hypothetical protein [Acetobacter garciniae]
MPAGPPPRRGGHLSLPAACLVASALLMQAAAPAALARHRSHKPEAAPPTSVAAICDNADFQAKQQAFENGGPKGDVAVHICGTVVAVAAHSSRTRSGVHGYFYVAVAPDISIRIVTNLDEMHTPAWPWVSKGDKVEVVGRYYYDSYRSQGIDWTHRGTGRSWPIPGFVTVNGTKYD